MLCVGILGGAPYFWTTSIKMQLPINVAFARSWTGPAKPMSLTRPRGRRRWPRKQEAEYSSATRHAIARLLRTLVQALEARGLPCRISSRDVPGGANYQASIVHAIRNAKVMLLVFTESANNSDEIKKEIALASRNNLVVIPVRIEDVVPNDALEFELSTRQWIDFFGDWERAVEALFKRILSILRLSLRLG